MASFRKRLASMDKTWETAKKRKGGVDALPDGRYRAKITKAYLHESEKEELFAVFHFTVLDGEHKGDTARKYNRLANEDGLFFLKRDLERLGVDVPGKLADLEDCLNDLQDKGLVVRIKSKTKGEFSNIYIDKLMGEDDADGDEDEAEEPGEVEDAEEEEEEEAPPPKPTKPKKSAPAPAPEPDEDEDSDADADESQVDVEIGTRVEVEGKGEGTVSKVDEENNLVHVKLDSGKKAVADPDKILVLKNQKAPKA